MDELKFNKQKLALVVSLLLFVGFIVMVWGVSFYRPWIAELDRFGNELFRLEMSEVGVSLIYSFTQIGNIRTLLLTALVVSIVLFYREGKYCFLWFGFSMGIAGGGAPLLMKNVIQRARPVDGLMTRSGYSFPSGHTMGSLALYGLIIILAAIYIKKVWLRYVVMVGSFMIILIISWSRIHLGFHFLSDIMGSFFFGLSLLIVAWQILLKVNGATNSYKEL